MPSYRSAFSLRQLLSTLLLSVTLLAPPLYAENTDEADFGPEFWERYTDILNGASLRMKLTREQEKKVIPIIEKSFELRKLILEEYGLKGGKLPKLSDRQKEELEASIAAVRLSTRSELVQYLNKEQLVELKKIQQEVHDEFRQRLEQS